MCDSVETKFSNIIELKYKDLGIVFFLKIVNNCFKLISFVFYCHITNILKNVSKITFNFFYYFENFYLIIVVCSIFLSFGWF